MVAGGRRGDGWKRQGKRGDEQCNEQAEEREVCRVAATSGWEAVVGAHGGGGDRHSKEGLWVDMSGRGKGGGVVVPVCCVAERAREAGSRVSGEAPVWRGAV